MGALALVGGGAHSRQKGTEQSCGKEPFLELTPPWNTFVALFWKVCQHGIKPVFRGVPFGTWVRVYQVGAKIIVGFAIICNLLNLNYSCTKPTII